jgi:N utilization substance protein B
MTTSVQKLAARSSKKARSSAARLAAVQAVYQMRANDQSARQVVEEYKSHRLGESVEGDQMIVPDGVLFQSLVDGVEERLVDLIGMLPEIEASRPKMDLILQSILLCGAFEMIANPDTDAPIIIADYLNVSHAFYDQGESKLVNAVLDRIAKAVRGAA